MASLLREARWNELLARLGATIGVEGYFSMLIAAYAEPHRHYHNSDHIEHCLREFHAVRELAKDPYTLEMALWLHDVIYQPRADDNEELSGKWAMEMFANSGCPDTSVDRVIDLILATKTHQQTEDSDLGLLLDIDLSILGQSAAIYDKYEMSIRAEYKFVPKPLYKIGRRKILHSFSQRSSIFQTRYFHDRYEEKARLNLQRAITAL